MAGSALRQVSLLLGSVLLLSVVAASTPSALEQTGADAAPIYGVTVPRGYRDWKMIYFVFTQYSR